MDTETWREIPGYAFRYEASTEGNVRSLGFWSANRWGTQTWRTPCVLQPYVIHPQGYRGVTLVDEDGVHRKHKLHRIILTTFVSVQPPGKRYALHKDDDKSNNRLSNLYWGSRVDNAHDSIANGTHIQAAKARCLLGHRLVPPNLVESSLEKDARSCLACKLSQANARHEVKLRTQGRQRTRYNRGRDGFQRRAGETWQEEAHRRYAHVMRDYAGGL